MANNTFAVLRQMLASLDDAKKYQSLRDVMSTMNAPDLAAVFEDLPEEKMPVLFRLCPKDLAADVFAELSSETQEALIRGLTDRELKSVVEELCVDDATDLVEEMPANVVKRILGQADPTTRRMINELLQYPEDSAGGVMTTELMELRPDMTVAQAMEAIRRNGFDKETINNCYVTDDSRRLIGVVSLRALVQNTAQLPQIDLAVQAPKSILGRSTSACLQNGFVLGTASLLDGLADRFRAELGPETAFYATGNLPEAIRTSCRTPIAYRSHLISDGLYQIWLRNRKG